MESVLLHPEPTVLWPSPPHEGSRLPTLLGALLHAGGASQREAVMHRWLDHQGFDWLGFGRALVSAGQLTPVSFCTTYADQRWVRRYFDQRYQEVDPRLREVLKSSLPCTWTIESLAEATGPTALAGRLHRFVDEMRQTGTRSGVMLAMPAAPSEQRHIVSLGSRKPGSDWIDDQVIGQVLTLALCLHEVHVRHAEPPQPAPAAAASGLTTVQREILARVAYGMPDKLIASQLDMTLHNVDYHMRRLRRHFGVRNRVQLSKMTISGDELDAARCLAA